MKKEIIAELQLYSSDNTVDIKKKLIDMIEEYIRYFITQYVIAKSESNPRLKDSQLIYVKNLIFFSFFPFINVYSKSVDAFKLDNLRDLPNPDIIIWGSPHWTPSSSEVKDVPESTLETMRENIEQYFITFTSSQDGKEPKINLSYEKDFTLYEKTKRYDSHAEYKAGVLHYFINKNPNTISVITFGESDKIPQSYYQNYYNEDCTPYNGRIYYVFVDTPGYIPSASQDATERGSCDRVGALIYIYLQILLLQIKLLLSLLIKNIYIKKQEAIRIIDFVYLI